MKKSGLFVAGALAVISIAGTALAAGSWSAYGQILDYEDYGVGPALALDVAVQNPSGCASTSRYLMYAGLSEEQKDRISRTVLAAYMAGMRIKVKVLSGPAATSCVEGNPAYYAVDIAK